MCPEIKGLDILKRSATQALRAVLPACMLMLTAAPAWAHPHVFAEASLEIAIDEGGNVEALRHLWRFDDLFSSTVLLEFDKNSDLELDVEELEQVASVIHESLAEFDYFQFVTLDGQNIRMLPPERIIADFHDSQLIVLFETHPEEPLHLAGIAGFGVYDPTFYTAIDFYDDASLSVTALPANCVSKVVRPDPDEAIAINQNSLTDAFFADPASNDMSKLFATRLELTCKG